MVRRVAIVGVLLLLATPAVAHANGDPASDYLLVQSTFLPFNAKVDPKAAKELADTVRAANEKGFKIKVAVIGSRYDLGTAFSLYNKAQKYAEFLGLELSFQYRDGLLVVMPNGYGYTINGKADPAGIRLPVDRGRGARADRASDGRPCDTRRLGVCGARGRNRAARGAVRR